jgi:5-methylthioadenosine/S-adenosylhomocysteine deaminase
MGIFGAMQAVDWLIAARWIVPVKPHGTVLDHHALVLHEGRIADLLPAGEASEKYRPSISYTLDRHALIPGLINAHTHAAMTLLRGLADDLPLMEWLKGHIWPAEQRWVGEQFVHDGTQLAVAEMLRGGTTCFNDMYFFPEVTARVAANTGIRASIGLILVDFASAWASNPDEYISKGLEIYDEHKGQALIQTAFAPHAPYTVSDSSLQRIGTLANELEIAVHMHVQETTDEINQSIAVHTVRPLERLSRMGLLSSSLLAVHMTQVLDQEIAKFAESGAHVLHCPESNLKLASGFCPVHKFLDAGVNVALGTDGAASNDDLDMFGEMRTAALLAKGVSSDASALPAAQALRMATLNGAVALGLGSETGSIEIGKSADIVAVDLGSIEAQPLYNPVSQLVYATTRDKVSDVWVAGRHLLKDRALTTIDEKEILHQVHTWRDKIRGGTT